MNDLLGFSGAAKEIVNAVSAGIGTIYRPRSIRAEADAQAYASIVRAEAEAQSSLIARASTGDEIATRALQRLKTTLVGQQKNLEDVFERAIQIANVQHDVGRSAGRVDSDWMALFINHSQNVAQKDVQELWARALAKEASEEGSISIRTLDVLRAITRSDALAFQAFLKIEAAFGGKLYPVEHECLHRNGLHEKELYRLAALGLVRSPTIEWTEVQTQIQQCYPLLSCILQHISPFTTCISGNIVSIYGTESVSLYAYRLSEVGEEIKNSIGMADVSSIDRRELFESFVDVVGLRQGYTFKVNGDVEDAQSVQFQRSEEATKEYLARSREDYKKWRELYRK